jgi:hypothetical protein
MARKGAVPKDRVLNSLALPAFECHLMRRKGKSSLKRTRPIGTK